MAKTLRPYVPEQRLLLPPSVQDWVPQGQVARFINDVVDDLDLSAIESAYGEERRYPPYNPRMMTKVLPGRSIRFRKQHGRALSQLCAQAVRLCREAGLVRLGRVAVDGTKIKANASKHKAMSYGRMKDEVQQVERAIDGWLKKIREAKAALEAEVRAKAEKDGKDPESAKADDKAQHSATSPIPRRES